WALPIADEEGIQGWIVHIDRYGNLITNISEELLQKYTHDHEMKIFIGNTIIHGMDTTFGSVTEGEPAAIIGSSGMVEIVVNKGDAEEMLGVKKGAPISIMFQK
ncbi:MAG TPA: SAM hydroxide adenosyltransferase, partial [Balneolales bacterium]|nr:SAM hydroxide adenosyltransferase [Balneolales bacterium]